ncbi:MAG: protein-(glutamine-N5) methyltransferase, release factor-specific [Candidatus Omnitrophica bacterium CG22_combo_CG10-13_8_21_14_all_43_16]|nr:MAG: protein-(glutamine-N5) methyltransferase, release factor-specific [Candidatus Omnitrophica bacterium CG22_combo_CG10-13_8_21_14_all_43_16]
MILKTADSKKDIFYLINKYSRVISRVEAEMLLEFLFNCEKLDLYVRDFIINKTIEELYDMLASRRLNGESVQHITGRAEFMGLDFIVTKDVLIPRPETEILVNEILGAGFIAPKILDLCTGSGNIAVSLAKSMPQAEIIATDISENALKIAEKNAVLHQASAGIKFYKGNLFNALMFAKNPKFDIIVCNPPYIKEAEIPFLQKEVRSEPLIALNGGKDGLDFYRDIAKESRKFLRKGSSILLEMGFGQREAIEDIFLSYNIFSIYRVIRDFSGIERAIWINLL